MPYSSATLDPYAALGVTRDASPQAIKQAYRRIALETHPDRNPGDADAAERFRRASQAYALLRDPERRPIFDRTGRWDLLERATDLLDVQLAEAVEIFAREFGAAADLTRTDRSAPAHASSVSVPVDVTWHEVERGGRRQVSAPCSGCAGSGGREGSAQVRCTACGGSGRLRNVQNSVLGPRIQTERCQSCHGSGRRPLLVCVECDGSGRAPGGQPLEVLIPRGVADGESLYALSANGPRLVARVTEDRRWARDGADLYATGRIPYELAVLGGVADLELPGRKYSVQVAPATASGHRSRVPGQGLPRRDGSGRGDLVLTLHVAVPERVGGIERWLLAARRLGSDTSPARDLLERICRLQGRAWRAAADCWQRWRQLHRRSSLQRIETAAASLRSTARFIGESEERLGPMLEKAFPLIAPEAAEARRRVELHSRNRQGSAFGTLAVDVLLVAALTAALWLGARFAAPALVDFGGHPWWRFASMLHPASLALAPLLLGVAAGAVRAHAIHRTSRRLLSIPVGLALAATWVVTATGCYAVASTMLPGMDVLTVGAMTGALALTIGLIPFILFLLGSSIVTGGSLALQERAERVDRRVLRDYDVAAARLAVRLQGMERSFRQLLAQAHDSRHPLTSLLEEAAEALAREDDRPWRAGRLEPALALLAGVAVTVIWGAAAILTVTVTVGMIPEAAGWFRATAAVVTLALCGVGAFLPPAFLERPRLRNTATSIAVTIAALALAGLLVVGYAGPWAAWLMAAVATTAVVLSFRIRESTHATGIAFFLLGSGALGLLLLPATLITAFLRRGRTAGS